MRRGMRDRTNIYRKEEEVSGLFCPTVSLPKLLIAYHACALAMTMTHRKASSTDLLFITTMYLDQAASWIKQRAKDRLGRARPARILRVDVPRVDLEALEVDHDARDHDGGVDDLVGDSNSDVDDGDSDITHRRSRRQRSGIPIDAPYYPPEAFSDGSGDSSGEWEEEDEDEELSYSQRNDVEGVPAGAVENLESAHYELLGVNDQLKAKNERLADFEEQLLEVEASHAERDIAMSQREEEVRQGEEELQARKEELLSMVEEQVLQMQASLGEAAEEVRSVRCNT